MWPIGIGVDDGADAGNQHHHDRAQAVDIEAHGKGHDGSDRVVEPNGDGSFCRHQPQGTMAPEKLRRWARPRSSHGRGDVISHRSANNQCGQQWKQWNKQHGRHQHLTGPLKHKSQPVCSISYRRNSVGLYCDRPLAQLPVRTIKAVRRGNSGTTVRKTIVTSAFGNGRICRGVRV